MPTIWSFKVFMVYSALTIYGYDCKITSDEARQLRDKAIEMFEHAYNSYMLNAFPADELMPLTCQGRSRGNRPSRGDIDESLGNFTLTLVDTLDTLALLNKLDEFETALRLVIEKTTFNTDVVVSVFETNIRVLGGLLGGHVAALELKGKDKCCQWYTDELLKKALDLGERLLPAFNTTSGIPYPKVNLMYGLKGLSMRDTCTACAGTMVLEFAALSRLTGDHRFERAAHKAMDFLWEQRNIQSNLMGTVLNIHNGDWVRRDSSIGAGIDSYYEYLLKAYILLGETVYLQRFNKHYDAIMTYLSQGPLMLTVDMHKPTSSGRNIMDSLLAFWPGLQVLKGDLKSAIEMHEVLYQITQRHNFLPEAVTTDFHVHWGQHPLRPEFVESTYFLYKATGDPHYLEVGRTVLENLEKHARVPCGFAAIKDVRAGTHEDQMDSYVLAETFKYLYLLFEEESNLVLDVSHYVFTTEAHLLPLSLANHSTLANKPAPGAHTESKIFHDHSCPNINAFKGMSAIRYAEMVRAPLKNFVELKCPKPKAGRPPRLRVAEFSADDAKQVVLLRTMGVRVSHTPDGRLQLTHQPNEAETTELADEGLAFMREMLAMAQNVKELPPDPRVVQIINKEKKSTTVFQAGAAQFGWDFNPPAEGKKVQKAFKTGIKAAAVKVEPYHACVMGSSDLYGKIAIVTRGLCTFIDKARICQNQGASGVIVIDQTEGTTSASSLFFQMSGDGVEDVKIPMVFLYHAEGAAILRYITENPEAEIFIGRRKLEDAEFEELSTPRNIILTSGTELTIYILASKFQLSWTVQTDLPEKESEITKDSVKATADSGEVTASALSTKAGIEISLAGLIRLEDSLPVKGELFERTTDRLRSHMSSCKIVHDEEKTLLMITSLLNYVNPLYDPSDKPEWPSSVDEERVVELIKLLLPCVDDKSSSIPAAEEPATQSELPSISPSQHAKPLLDKADTDIPDEVQTNEHEILKHIEDIVHDNERAGSVQRPAALEEPAPIKEADGKSIEDKMLPLEEGQAQAPETALENSIPPSENDDKIINSDQMYNPDEGQSSRTHPDNKKVSTGKDEL